MGYIYVIETSCGKVKIGRSKSPEKRFEQIAYAEKIAIKRSFISGFIHNEINVEKQIFRKIRDRGAKSEWFNFDFETAVKKVIPVLKEFGVENFADLEKEKTSTYVKITKSVIDESKKIFKELGYTVPGGIERALVEFNERHKKEIKDHGKAD